uniref:Uncharacterized protein n=1 Tax=Chenopodium quinoa TaxID=63459 RepID=A0A803MMJ1_CHEQI
MATIQVDIFVSGSINENTLNEVDACDIGVVGDVVVTVDVGFSGDASVNVVSEAGLSDVVDVCVSVGTGVVQDACSRDEDFEVKPAVKKRGRNLVKDEDADVKPKLRKAKTSTAVVEYVGLKPVDLKHVRTTRASTTIVAVEAEVVEVVDVEKGTMFVMPIGEKFQLTATDVHDVFGILMGPLVVPVSARGDSELKLDWEKRYGGKKFEVTVKKLEGFFKSDVGPIDGRKGPEEYWTVVMNEQPIPEFIKDFINAYEAHEKGEADKSLIKDVNNNEVKSFDEDCDLHSDKLASKKLIADEFEPSSNPLFYHKYQSDKPISKKLIADEFEPCSNPLFYHKYQSDKPISKKLIADEFEPSSNPLF